MWYIGPLKLCTKAVEISICTFVWGHSHKCHLSKESGLQIKVENRHHTVDFFGSILI